MAIGKMSFVLLAISVAFFSNLICKVVKISLFDYIQLPTTIDVFTNTEKLLIIGVMSAQQHFKERESIRNTWAKLINPNLIDIKFLIGSEICQIPPQDRVTSYVCEKWSISVPQSLNMTTINNVNNFGRLSKGYIGFTFIVKHNISVLRLGIYSQILNNGRHEKARVLLLDAASGKKLTSATFPRGNYSDLGFVRKAVQMVKLPAGFEGELKLSTLDSVRITCPPNLVKDSVIHIFEVADEYGFKRETESPCLLAGFDYYIEDIGKLRQFIVNENARLKDWENQTIILKYQLGIESKAYNDILFIDLIDVYKNLTRKLFEFLKWTNHVDTYRFILKTDDDVFLDISRITSTLLSSNPVDDKWDWWSCFHENQPPSFHGKWRDRLYSYKLYPTFPSGAGYVLTKRVLGKVISIGNAHEQAMYYGEDVAIGVWMNQSVYEAKRFNTNMAYWACGDVCSEIRPCNVAQLQWPEMHYTKHLLDTNVLICFRR